MELHSLPTTKSELIFARALRVAQKLKTTAKRTYRATKSMVNFMRAGWLKLRSNESTYLDPGLATAFERKAT